MNKLKQITNRRGQIQTMETILVLFVFFILLALAMIFYVAYFNSENERGIMETKLNFAGELAITVSNLPELHFSQQGIGGVNNFDVYKIQAFSNVVNSDENVKLAYNSRFGTSKIIIREVYPNNNNWTIYDNSQSIVSSDDLNVIRPFFIPITIHYPRNAENPIGKNSFGVLEVWYYG